MQHTWIHGDEPVTSLWPNDEFIPEVKIGDTSEILAAIEKVPMIFKGVFKEMLKQIRRPITIDIPQYDRFIDSVEDSDECRGWQRFIILLQKAGVTFKKQLPFIKLFSLELKLQCAYQHNNPAFQRYKVFYHGSWDRWWSKQPRLSISLQKFLRDFCNLRDDMDTTLRAIHRSTLYFDPDSVKFEITNEIVAAYQNYVEGPHTAPSVSGSCMAQPEKIPEAHPCRVYEESDDVLLGRLYDPESGKTIARCLLNKVHMTISRFYGSGKTSQGHEAQMEYLVEKLEDAGYTRDFSLGLDGCRLPKIRCSGEYLMPYLDGDACGVVDDGTDWLVARGYDWCCDRTDGYLGVKEDYGEENSDW